MTQMRTGSPAPPMMAAMGQDPYGRASPAPNAMGGRMSPGPGMAYGDVGRARSPGPHAGFQ